MFNIDSINSKTVELLLKRYGYYFYVIKRFKNVKCTCLDPTSKDADSNCTKCLGTGTKIKIYKVFGCLREEKEREISVAQNLSSSPKIVYIKGFKRFEKDDIVIDNEDVYHIMEAQYHRGEKGEFAFTRAICPFTKGPDFKFIRNFYKIINEHKIRKN